jgi:hypothetical protein
MESNYKINIHSNNPTIKGHIGHFTSYIHFKNTREVVLPNTFQNESIYIKEAAPLWSQSWSSFWSSWSPAKLTLNDLLLWTYGYPI